MKKIVIASILLAGTSLLAGEYFIGGNLERTNTSSTATLKLTSGTVTNNNTTYTAGDTLSLDGSMYDTHINFKFGLLNDNDRYYIQNAELADLGIVSYHSLTFNYDKFLDLGVSKVKPFVGAHAGLGMSKGIVRDTGFEFGVQTGFIKDINNKIQFEAGIRHTISTVSFSDTDTLNAGTYRIGSERYTVASGGADITSKSDIDDITTFYIGLNYKL